MQAHQLASKILAELDALPEKKTVPMRRVRRAYSKQLRSESAEFVLALAQAIISARPDHRRWVAYELIQDHPAAFRSLDREKLEALGQGINSWWTTDSFGRTLAGPAWRDGLIAIDAIRDWARSPDRWWRRAALVSTVALNMRSYGGKGDVPQTLAICEMLADDHDDMVVKGLSWALRELVVHDAEAVQGFLDEHREVLAARVKREVTNKITTGLKNP